MIEFDVLLQQMGRLGPYQKRQLLLLMLPGLLAAIHMGSNVFIGAEIEHWCLYENKSYLEQVIFSFQANILEKKINIVNYLRNKF